MLLDDDDIQINVTKKSYKLIKSTKQLITNSNDTNNVIELSMKVAEIIDKRVWGNEFIVKNPYLKLGYENGLLKLKRKKRKTRFVKVLISAHAGSRYIF